MRRVVFSMVALLGLAAAPARAVVPVSLRGSPESMERQNQIARDHGLTFAETPGEVRALENEGGLVRLEGNADYELAGFVRHPQARPEMRTFIERLSAEYRAATGEKLVVTSLTRPASRQPGNAHALSVHPTGIAVDLRVSRRAHSRQWLESTLLSLEEKGLLDITRERNPPHYHVALFPGPYMAHVERRLAEEEAARAAAPGVPAGAARRQADARASAVAPVIAAIPLALLALLLRRRIRPAPTES